jgi:hypothetical protein
MALAATNARERNRNLREFAELHGKPPLLNHSLLKGQKWGRLSDFNLGERVARRIFWGTRERAF